MVKIPSLHIKMAGVFGLVVLLMACTKENLSPYEYPGQSAVIKELILDCNQSQLSSQAYFWTNIMGFELAASSNTGFSVKTGQSTLTFRRDQNGYGGNYQFTFEIPENQIENARTWILKRSSVVQDASTGAEIQHKSKQNAHSLFFRDPAGNLVEFIARHNLKNAREGEFQKEMILGISNATVVTRNVKDCGDTLFNQFQLPGIQGSSNSVKLCGGQEGTITLHVPYRAYYPTEDNQALSYRMVVVIRNPVSKEFKLPGSEATIRSEP